MSETLHHLFLVSQNSASLLLLGSGWKPERFSLYTLLQDSSFVTTVAEAHWRSGSARIPVSSAD